MGALLSKIKKILGKKEKKSDSQLQESQVCVLDALVMCLF